MKAMNYELLLRVAYNSNRNYKSGADSDIYREMEMANAYIDDPNWAKPKHEKEYDFRKAFSAVRYHVRNALSTALRNAPLNDEEKQIFETMISKLDMNFYNKKELDAIIEQAGDIFLKHGLKA